MAFRLRQAEEKQPGVKGEVGRKDTSQEDRGTLQRPRDGPANKPRTKACAAGGAGRRPGSGSAQATRLHRGRRPAQPPAAEQS